MSCLSLNRWKPWIVALLLPWLAACSAVRLTYSQGPLLAFWWLDGHVDFTSQQTPLARAALDDWFAWHRSTQLVDYAALLATAQRLAADSNTITPAQVCRLVEDGERKIELAFEQAVPALAEIVRSFSPAQLRHLEHHYAKGNDKWQRDFVQSSVSERQEATHKRWVERAESVYGRLDETQRGLLAEALTSSAFDAGRLLAERRMRQQDILRGLRQLQAEPANTPHTQAMLRAFAAQVTQSPRADYRAYRQQLVQSNCLLIARLHNTTGATQRQRAVARLKDWEDDLRALVRDGAAGKSPALSLTAP